MSLDPSTEVTVVYAVVPTAELDKVKFPKHSFANGYKGYKAGEFLDRGITMVIGQKVMVDLYRLTKKLFPNLEEPTPSKIVRPKREVSL